MAKLIEVAAQIVGPHLESGETLVDSVRVSRKGTAKRTAAVGAVGGLIGVAIAQKADRAGREQAAAAGFPELQSMTLVLTDRRVFVCKNSAMANKPKDVVMVVPIHEIVSVRYEAGKLVPKIFVGLSHGVEIELEAARIDNPSSFAAALDARVTSRAA
jgi:hypothetical protein